MAEHDKTERVDETRMVLEMFKSISNQVAINNKLVIEFIEDMKLYRTEREKHEHEKQLSTQEKIKIELSKRFDMGEFFRDRILPAIVIALLLKLMQVY